MVHCLLALICLTQRLGAASGWRVQEEGVDLDSHNLIHRFDSLVVFTMKCTPPNQVPQETRRERRGGNRCVGSLGLGR